MITPPPKKKKKKKNPRCPAWTMPHTLSTSREILALNHDIDQHLVLPHRTPTLACLLSGRRVLRNSLNKGRPEHYSTDRLNERTERESCWHLTLRDRERSVFGQSPIGTVWRATLGSTAERRGGCSKGCVGMLSWNWEQVRWHFAS